MAVVLLWYLHNAQMSVYDPGNGVNSQLEEITAEAE